MVVKAEHANLEILGSERAYEKYGWVILSVSALLGIVAALVATLPPISWFWDPLYESAYSIMGAWGVTWVGFNVFALVLTLIPFRRGERWAWYTLWMVPLLWVSQFVFAPDITYLMLAGLAIVGLVLPRRRFFFATEDEPSRDVG